MYPDECPAFEVLIDYYATLGIPKWTHIECRPAPITRIVSLLSDGLDNFEYAFYANEVKPLTPAAEAMLAVGKVTYAL